MSVIPVHQFVIPVHQFVIPVKTGIQILTRRLSAGLSGVAQAKSEALAKAESALVRRRWNLKSIPLSLD